MIEKIKEDAYFVVDDLSFMSRLTAYDPMVSNQSISFEQEIEVDIEQSD